VERFFSAEGEVADGEARYVARLCARCREDVGHGSDVVAYGMRERNRAEQCRALPKPGGKGVLGVGSLPSYGYVVWVVLPCSMFVVVNARALWLRKPVAARSKNQR